MDPLLLPSQLHGHGARGEVLGLQVPGGLGAQGRQTRTWQFSKTKMCKFEIVGMCAKGTQCPFAHGREEMKPLPDLTCTKLCKTLIQTGICDVEGCKYAHSKEELRATSTFHKTKLCRFSQIGHCALGAKCNFAHSPQEIRTIEDPLEPQGYAESSPLDFPHQSAFDQQAQSAFEQQVSQQSPYPCPQTPSEVFFLQDQLLLGSPQGRASTMPLRAAGQQGAALAVAMDAPRTARRTRRRWRQGLRYDPSAQTGDLSLDSSLCRLESQDVLSTAEWLASPRPEDLLPPGNQEPPPTSVLDGSARAGALVGPGVVGTVPDDSLGAIPDPPYEHVAARSWGLAVGCADVFRDSPAYVTQTASDFVGDFVVKNTFLELGPIGGPLRPIRSAAGRLQDLGGTECGEDLSEFE